ncbi:MAG: cystathionine gamma-synthase [Pseudomonadales bacterium]|nr:cystathionine gamma-synthase [Pseudomonadales bacterium]MCP5184338.1 cystathionine gamma-synthase [Pseudomonadales bacterium]
MKDASNTHDLGFETRAIHAHQAPDPVTGAVVTPLYLTSTYAQSAPGVHQGYEYSRSHNPTRTAYERCVADLEGGRYGFAFASGCVGATTVMHLLSQGDHVVCCDDMYGGTLRLFERVFRKQGLDFTYLDLTDPGALEAAIRPNTKLLWLESPTNPLMKLVDIRALADIAHARGVRVMVDNTFMSPYFQRPLALGADMVLHSSTKYINGHSDLIGGVVVTDDEALGEELKFLANAVGGVQATFDAYLCLRSLKTLAVRMQAHAANAMAVAHFLEAHPKVARVLYPGLPSFPQHDLAKRQASGFGGMMAIELASDLAGARRFLEAVRIFTLAESLGGVESLIEHPAIMTHASVPADVRAKLGIGDTLIRLSIGIETCADLLADLDQALHAV